MVCVRQRESLFKVVEELKVEQEAWVLESEKINQVMAQAGMFLHLYVAITKEKNVFGLVFSPSESVQRSIGLDLKRSLF